jgi:hypothetical protein
VGGGGGGVWNEAVPPFRGGGGGLPCDFGTCGAHYPESGFTAVTQQGTLPSAEFRIGIIVWAPGPIGADDAFNFVFKHGARHLAGKGLSAAEVEATIAAEIQAMSREGAQIGGEFWGWVKVAGQTIQYRAWPLAKNLISIGTYYPIP